MLSAFQRGAQRVSWTALLLLLIGWTFVLMGLCLALAKMITWLDYLYYFSYMKLAVSLVKYVPQVSYPEHVGAQRELMIVIYCGLIKVLRNWCSVQVLIFSACVSRLT